MFTISHTMSLSRMQSGKIITVSPHVWRLFMNMSVAVRYVFRCLCESQCKNSKNTLTYQEVILICNCMVCGEGM